MKKNSLFRAIVLLISTPVIASCGIWSSQTSSDNQDSSTAPISQDSSASTVVSSSSISSASSDSSSIDPGDIVPGDVYEATFSHSFTTQEIAKEGGTTDVINGLAFTYTPITYLAASAGGIQIGSNGNPQSNPLVLSTVLPEGTYVTGWSIVVATNSNKNGLAEVVFGDHTFSQNFSVYPGTQTISETDLDVPTTDFALSLSSNSGAVYLYNLTIELRNDYGLLEGIVADSVEPSDPVVPGQGNVLGTNYEPVEPETYYEGIDIELTGEDLIQELRPLISVMTAMTYGDARYSLLYTDEDLEYTGYTRGIWDGDLITANWGDNLWQREHVWSQSHLNMDDDIEAGYIGAASDLHNLRVACAESNNYHSNKYYDDVDGGLFFNPDELEGKIRGVHKFEDDHRGDAARILFYMAVRYEGLALNDVPDSNPEFSEGVLTTLLEWDRLDPVDDFEIQRNNRVYEYQGNRNPFIDFYEENLAQSIWG